jgi:hypothetical protein
VQQPAAEQREENRADVYEHCGGASVATTLPDEVIKATPEIPWREVKGMRIIDARAYHRIDYEMACSPSVTGCWPHSSSTRTAPLRPRAV